MFQLLTCGAFIITELTISPSTWVFRTTSLPETEQLYHALTAAKNRARPRLTATATGMSPPASHRQAETPAEGR